MTIAQPRVQDTLAGLRRGTFHFNTIAKGSFDNQCKTAAVYVAKLKSEIISRRTSETSRPPDTLWTARRMEFIAPLPETRKNNVEIVNGVDSLTIMIRSIPIPMNADAVPLQSDSKNRSTEIIDFLR